MKSFELSVNSSIHKTREILFSNLDDEILGIDSQAGYFYSMNQTANRVWELISEPLTFGELIAHICSEYDVAEDVCREEIFQLLKELHKAGLIRADHETK